MERSDATEDLQSLRASGKYAIKVDMIGYKSVQMDDSGFCKQNHFIDIEMEQTVIKGEVVTVEVSRLTLKKDQTVQ